jgi:pyridoxine 5'-phosphate synthase PdxJ
MKNTRLAGHGLRNEGAAFVKLDDGRWRRVDSSRRAGHGLCECGAHSGWLDSDGARKRWHHEHKLQEAMRILADAGVPLEAGHGLDAAQVVALAASAAPARRRDS